MKREKGRNKAVGGAYAPIKRLLDVMGALCLLTVLGVPMLGIACLICLDSPGGALFRQERVGRRGKHFLCYKFRTMTADAPPNVPKAALPHAERWITPIGRFLRRSSLDELPQLWNVLRGEMSLVGARPLIPEEETVHAIRRQSDVWFLRPGMTGLAQIHGRDRLSDAEKAYWDIRYAEKIGLREDVRILAQSLFCVLRAQNVVEGNA